jgi:hypothetical protein
MFGLKTGPDGRALDPKIPPLLLLSKEDSRRVELLQVQDQF